MGFEVLLPTQEINKNSPAIYKASHFVAWGNVAESQKAQVLNRYNSILGSFIKMQIPQETWVLVGPHPPLTPPMPTKRVHPILLTQAPGLSSAVLRMQSLFLRILRCKVLVKNFLKDRWHSFFSHFQKQLNTQSFLNPLHNLKYFITAPGPTTSQQSNMNRRKQCCSFKIE